MITTIPASTDYPGLTRLTINGRTFVATGDPKHAKPVLERHIKEKGLG